MIILFNKPFRVMCQFTDEQGRATLADYVPIQNVYPAGRLDYDSEGLVLLTDDGRLQHQMAHPDQKTEKTYLAQVEGTVSESAIAQLCKGVLLRDGPAHATGATRIPEPTLWKRDPPIRERRNIPTDWIELKLTQGRNRQVRRMTAAVGHPTLRLVRVSIGPWRVDDLSSGTYRVTNQKL